MSVTLRLLISSRNQEHVTLELPLPPGYGLTAEVAHEVVLLALTAAERPMLLDAEGRLWEFEPGALRAVVTWQSEG